MMRVLTVRQPWAWAIIHGGKDVENRPRNVAGDYTGPVAIHAGLNWADGITVEQWRLLVPAWAAHGADETVRFPSETYTEVMPLGMIIGVVELVEVHHYAECVDVGTYHEHPDGGGCQRIEACSDWAEPDRKHLVLADPRPLTEPMPYRGALHLQTHEAGRGGRIAEEAAVSVKVSSWVWHEARDKDGNEVDGNELVFLLALADVADDNGRCRFVDDESDLTYQALGKKARVSKSTVIRMVASLREGGLVEHSPGVKGRPNEFRIVVPWAKASGVNLTPNGSDSVSTEPGFGVKTDTRTSLKRIDVTTTRGTRLPKGWKPSELLLQWAAVKAPSVDVAVETENFSDYWTAVSGARGVKLDWDATWRTWMRRTHQRAVERGWTPALVSDPETDWMRTRA